MSNGMHSPPPTLLAMAAGANVDPPIFLASPVLIGIENLIYFLVWNELLPFPEGEMPFTDSIHSILRDSTVDHSIEDQLVRH
jgi:hypothetical protein